MDEAVPTSTKKITLYVIAGHAVLLCWMGMTVSEAVYPPKRERLLVQTVTLTPKKPAAKPKVETVPKPAPKPQAEAPKPVEKKVEKKPEPTQNSKAIAKAQENIAKIQQTRDKSSVKPSSLPSLKKVEPAAAVAAAAPSFAVEERCYRDELAGRLKLLLKLPEWGRVVIELTLTRSGQVKDLKVVSGESMENRRYVEKTVPGLKFPGFGDHFGLASTHTFQITLENEI